MCDFLDAFGNDTISLSSQFEQKWINFLNILIVNNEYKKYKHVQEPTLVNVLWHVSSIALYTILFVICAIYLRDICYLCYFVNG